MTQLGEMVAIGLITEQDLECPFHTQHHCSDAVNNITKANGTKLGENLHSNKPEGSTVTRRTEPPYSEHCKPVYAPDPDKTIAEEHREVYLVEGDENRRYPLGYSAHHLIPGKASMREAEDLHEYIDAGDVICCNLGYDVDGSENGVWLPGLHAVKGALWGQADLGAEEEVVERVELTDKVTPWSYARINGPRADMPGAFEPDNMKWRYVQRAMTFSSVGVRQFHDAHPDYSNRVLEHLADLAAVLQKLAGVPAAQSACPKAKEHGKSKDGKCIPPASLLKLLNQSSDWYRRKLVGSTQNSKYFTSSWCGPDAPAKPPLDFRKVD